MPDGISRNLTFVYARILGITVLSFLTTRFSFQALGQSDLGLFSVIGGIIIILNVFNTAMMTTTRRYLNYEIGNGPDAVNAVFNICLVIHFALAVLVFVLAESIGMVYIDHFLNIPPGRMHTARTIFHISVATAVLGVINVPFQGLMNANERFQVIAVFDLIREIVKCALVFVLIFIDCDRIVAYTYIMTGATLLSLSCYYFYSLANWKEIIRFRICRDIGKYKEILSFNNYIAIGAGSCILNGQGRNIILNFFFGTIVNGAYSIAYSVETLCVTVITNITTATAPRVTKSYSQGKRDRAFSLAILTNKFSILTAIGLVLVINAEIEFLLKLWLGTIPEGAVQFCRIMLVNILIKSFWEGIPALSQAAGNIKLFQIGILVVDAVALPASCVLFRYGLPPTAIIFAYAVLNVAYCVFSIHVLDSSLHFDVTRLFRESYLPSGIVLLFSTVFYIAYIMLPSHGTAFSIVGMLVLLSLFCSVAFLFGLNADEKNRIKNSLRT